jgi:AraC-like DNA-binding protein
VHAGTLTARRRQHHVRNPTESVVEERLYVHSVEQFARECQLAAGVFLPPNDIIEVATAIRRVLGSAADCLRQVRDPRVASITSAFAARALSALEYSDQTGDAHSARQTACAAIRLIAQRHAHTPVLLKDIARAVGVSPSYMCDTLRHCSGSGFVGHIHTARILKAIVLLGNPGYTIGEVSRQCGYPRSFQLARHLRTAIGVSPRHFRRLAVASVANRSVLMRNNRF